MRHSLIIPAFNEAELLPRLLASVDVARARYHAGRDAVEVIVADNASTDDTPDVARQAGCRVVRVEKRSVAAARNGGARAARGEILGFVDADSRIHPDTFNAIDAAIAERSWIGGATGVRLDRWSVGLAATYLALLPMVVITGMDTGVVFCRRSDFDAVGGYDERRLFAEDVVFLWALKRLGWKRGQRLKRLRGVKATASTRKFDQFGDWHYFTQIVRLAWLALRRSNVQVEFANRYWYSVRERQARPGHRVDPDSGHER